MSFPPRPPFPLTIFFSFIGEKNPNLVFQICCVSSIDCLASDLASFLDVHFWFCTKELHFLLESGPGERERETAADPGNCEYAMVLLLCVSDPDCPALFCLLSLALSVNFPWGSSPELPLSALSTIPHF